MRPSASASAPTQLTSALTAAQDARLAAAVKAGELTQAQADAIKARRAADGTVLSLGRGPGGPGGHGGGPGGRGGGRELLADAAKAIGITEDALKTQLRDGKTLAAIVKAEGKTLADVQAAVKKAAVARLDADLKAKTHHPGPVRRGRRAPRRAHLAPRRRQVRPRRQGRRPPRRAPVRHRHARSDPLKET